MFVRSWIAPEQLAVVPQPDAVAAPLPWLYSAHAAQYTGDMPTPPVTGLPAQLRGT